MPGHASAHPSSSALVRVADGGGTVALGKCPRRRCDLTVCLCQITARYHRLEEGAVLHTRLNWITADTAALDGCAETMWRDPGARAAAPSIASIIRTEVPDEASGEIRAVEDYSLVFSSMQEP